VVTILRSGPVRLLFALLIALSLLACRSDTPRHAVLAAGMVVLAFGDSVTFGTGAKPGEEDYPSRLAARSGWKIVNAGIPGDTAELARGRITTVLQESRPAMVIIELGGNDFLRRRSESAVKEDLRFIVRAVKSGGAIPVLVAVPELSLGLTGLSDSAIYAALAKEEKVWLVPNVMSGVLSTEALRSDRIHPNAQGYQQMADGIAQSLMKAGLLTGS
jgi:acyl-CoA thioesterase-1